jgi:hypothetical protein
VVGIRVDLVVFWVLREAWFEGAQEVGAWNVDSELGGLTINLLDGVAASQMGNTQC